MPIERRPPLESKNPVTPTTACSLSSASDRRVVQVDLAPLEGLLQLGRQCVDVDLQPDPERRLWAQARPDAAVRGPGDRPMELQAVAPELLVAKGVEAEDLATLVDEPRRLRLHRLIAARRLRLLPGR
jgi:hypothetical protein